MPWLTVIDRSWPGLGGWREARNRVGEREEISGLFLVGDVGEPGTWKAKASRAA